MANFISVCKNVIASNNKRGWIDPDPSIRVANSAGGVAAKRGHTLAIKDEQGNIVARIISTRTGKPVLRCGAKVAIVTEYETEIIE